MQLELSNVFTVSVSATPAGLNAFNTSNLALFTADTAGGSFGAAGYKIYLDPSGVATDFGSSSATYKQAVAIFSQQPSIITGGGYLVVIPLNASETLDQALTRTKYLVNYFGVLNTTILIQADLLAAAAVLQASQKVGFFPQKTAASIAVGGALDLLRSGSFSQARALYYGATVDADALIYAAAYASRALSTNFSGSKTTQTMHLKDLVGVQPDPTMTQNYQTLAAAAGADTYPSVLGVSKVLSSGANRFFDQVYNQLWFVGASNVAAFNYLATTSTKIPQTESGMDGLKATIRRVCEQGVRNGYIAPGTWNSPNIFGDPDDFIANIAQRGYYIYSAPISAQLQVDRAARVAPLLQCAVKEAGAMHTGSMVVYINA